MKISNVFLSGISTDFLTKKHEVTFQIDSKKNDDSVLESISKSIQLHKENPEKGFFDIEIKEHREKRSLSANAYAHVLIDKLSDKLGISKPRCKNIMLGRYGQRMYLDDENTIPAIIKSNVPVSIMLEIEETHFFPCGMKKEDDQELIFYRMIRGSSTYDSKEMATFIDGIVSECKEQGIEIMPPEELERMVNAWQKA